MSKLMETVLWVRFMETVLWKLYLSDLLHPYQPPSKLRSLLTPLCFQFLASVWRPLAEDLSLFWAPLFGIPYLYLSEKLSVFQLSKRS